MQPTPKQQAVVREALGYDGVITQTFRRTLATILDEEGLWTCIGVDQLGHRHVSIAQDAYMARGPTHSEVADALDRTIGGSSDNHRVRSQTTWLASLATVVIERTDQRTR